MAIWTTVIVVAVLAESGTFTHSILINVAVRLFEYGMVALAAVVLGVRRPQGRRLRLVIPAVATLITLALLMREPREALMAALIALAVGLAIYGLSALMARRTS